MTNKHSIVNDIMVRQTCSFGITCFQIILKPLEIDIVFVRFLREIDKILIFTCRSRSKLNVDRIIHLNFTFDFFQIIKIFMSSCMNDVIKFKSTSKSRKYLA